MAIIMFVKQLSVFMENRPGRLAEITDVLSKNGIDIRALNIADTTDFGILRLIVSGPVKAESILRENSMTASITEVIAVSIEDSVGAFNYMISCLKDENISIEYIYSFIGEKSAKAMIVLKTSDIEASVKILRDHKVNVMTAKEVYDF